MKLTFGGVTLDTKTRQLLRGTEPVPLSPKAFELLVCLVENRPSALSKDALHDRVWPGLFVSDTNLAGLVAEIRRALGDDARTPRFVRTVQRFGYAFAGTVESARGDSSATLKGSPYIGGCWLARGTRQIPLADGENILGRDETAGPLASNSVSRRHARITVDGTSAYLEDLGSKNGTFLRGRSVSGRETLADGDTIKLGAVAFVFRAPASDRSTRTWKKGKL
jgi:DNA-binding winged helix-turn-helix (wHTH) protein